MHRRAIYAADAGGAGGSAADGHDRCSAAGAVALLVGAVALAVAPPPAFAPTVTPQPPTHAGTMQTAMEHLRAG